MLSNKTIFTVRLSHPESNDSGFVAHPKRINMVFAYIRRSHERRDNE